MQAWALPETGSSFSSGYRLARERGRRLATKLAAGECLRQFYSDERRDDGRRAGQAPWTVMKRRSEHHPLYDRWSQRPQARVNWKVRCIERWHMTEPVSWCHRWLVRLCHGSCYRVSHPSYLMYDFIVSLSYFYSNSYPDGPRLSPWLKRRQPPVEWDGC